MAKINKHRGVYSDEIIRKALRYKLKFEQGEITLKEIAKRVGVRSPQTVSNWFHQDMSKKGVEKRRMNRGHNRKISIEERRILGGWVMEQNLEKKPVTISTTRKFLKKTFGLNVHKSWVTYNMRRLEFTKHRTHALNKTRRSPIFGKQLVKFLTRIRRKRKQMKHIMCFDETTVNSSAVVPFSYSSKGR
jgi:transposase